MGTTQRKQSSASSWTRVDGQNTEQTITSAAGVLQRVIVSGDGALGSCIVSDGAAATPANILTQIEVPSGQTVVVEFNVNITNGIRVTPGETTTDICIIYN